MRPITFHAINPANEALRVRAIDGPGPGGASHEYDIILDRVDDPLRDGNPGQPRTLCTLRFQNGPVKENGEGVNGITHEALLAILIDRLTGFQSGPYANTNSAVALSHLEEALKELHDRTRRRMARGVEGTHMHPLTQAITDAVDEFSKNHQSLRQLMVNTLVAIVEGKVGPLIVAAKTEADNLRFQLADELNGGLALREERDDALAENGRLKARIHELSDEVGQVEKQRDRLVQLVGGGEKTLPLESKREVMP